MNPTPIESWQAVLRSYDRFAGQPDWQHVLPFRALVEQLSSAAERLSLFASESHETLVISKHNNGPAPDNLPRVVVQPWRDGNLTIIYSGQGDREECPCALGAGKPMIEQYMNRLVTESSESAPSVGTPVSRPTSRA